MKLRLHHIEMCVKDQNSVLNTLRNQFGLRLGGSRETPLCKQTVVKMEKTVFIITSRKKCLRRGINYFYSETNTEAKKDCELKSETELKGEKSEHWTVFCCKDDSEDHIDSVFNVSIQVEDLIYCINRIEAMGGTVLRPISRVADKSGYVDYAVIQSCCGNVIHTLIQKYNYDGWFLPGYTQDVDHVVPDSDLQSTTHFDHVALACRVGETNNIIKWYEQAFEMKRFISNSQETEEDGLMIGEDVGLRLKVMEFWKCSEAGLASNCSDDINSEDWDPLKIVVAESLPNISKNLEYYLYTVNHESIFEHKKKIEMVIVWIISLVFQICSKVAQKYVIMYIPGCPNSNRISTLSAVPVIADHTPKIKYIVPIISLWFDE